MDEERVKIHIYDTIQDTTAIWKLKSSGNCDNWICILSGITDLKYISPCDYLKIRIDFNDGRVRERMFYCDFKERRFIQLNSDCLDFWLKKENKESEGNKMPYKVTVTKTEEKELEEFWVMQGINKSKDKNFAFTASGPIWGAVGVCISQKELYHEPTKEEIAQFLSDCNADFVSVCHNYRFVGINKD